MIDRAERNFIEVDYHQMTKKDQFVSGDIFLSNQIREQGRIVAVLADGLGSGIKASVLATLTATMALKYTSSATDFRTSAEVIMETLPVCSERKVSYSTFTIVDVNSTGKARIIEHGNPPYVFIHGRREVPVERQEIILNKWSDRVISYSELHMERGDRIVFFSDGVSQAGLGNRATPLGWGKGVSEHIEQSLRVDGEMSAWSMSRGIVRKASWMDGKGPYDDVTCGVIYLRKPRQLLVVTGPPFSQNQDAALAQIVKNFPGRKVISGGTTADIIARELDCDIEIDNRLSCSGMPPAGRMDGVDLVTEGALTIGRTAAMLESGLKPNEESCDPASLMAAMLLDSDVVHFVVGTRVNEANQDPKIPVELDLRRNIVRRIAGYLEKNYFKETRVRYI